MDQYVFEYDTVTKDDPNKEVKGRSIKIHNQGSTVVWINREILLPDDQIWIEVPNNGFVVWRLQIKFLAPFPITNAIATYPQLYTGNRVHIVEMKKAGEDV